MKQFILILSFLTSINAFAGSYSLECSNLSRSIKIQKGEIIIKGKKFLYHEKDEAGLLGVSLEDFVTYDGPKVIIGWPDLDYHQDNRIKSVETQWLNSCGNSVHKRKFKIRVGIFNTDGNSLIDSVILRCKSKAVSGHYCAPFLN